MAEIDYIQLFAKIKVIQWAIGLVAIVALIPLAIWIEREKAKEREAIQRDRMKGRM